MSSRARVLRRRRARLGGPPLPMVSAWAVSLADALALALAARLGGVAEPTAVEAGGDLRVRVRLPSGPIADVSPHSLRGGQRQPLAVDHLDVRLRPDELPEAAEERAAWVEQACEWLAQAVARDAEERAVGGLADERA